MADPLPVLPALPEPQALMQAVFDYGAACHLAGRDQDGMPRQGSYAVEHAFAEYARAIQLEAYRAGLERAAAECSGMKRDWADCATEADSCDACASAIRALAVEGG